MDSDRVLVMDQGRVAEFDRPLVLLDRRQGAFAKLVESTGADSEELLRNLCKRQSRTLRSEF